MQQHNLHEVANIIYLWKNEKENNKYTYLANQNYAEED